MEFITGSNNQY